MRGFAILVFSCLFFSGWSQIYNPVKWTTELKDNGDGTYSFIANAKIDEGWWTYSEYLPSQDGPIPTTINFDEGKNYKLIGKATESNNAKKIYDEFFQMDVVKFLHTFTITQKLKITDPAVPLTGYINYMCCNSERCLPPVDVDFSLTPSKGSSGDATPKTTIPETRKTETPSNSNITVVQKAVEPEKKKVTEEAKPAADSSALAKNIPAISPTDSSTNAGLLPPVIKPGHVVDHSIPSLIATYEHPVNDCGNAPSKSKANLLWMLLFGMINGFVALLTPCVFPMIPLTVSFFTKGTKRNGFQNGLIYGASIILIYVVLGLLVTILFGAGSLNELSTNPYVNTAFFLIFIVFAFSFFGFYEITLPSSWSNRSDAMADKGGLIGIFFMAATLAIVSFSCTGPLIGSALVEASSKGFMAPLVVMFGFSFALAIPFGLFAAFPSWLNSLPKSGGWMNSVKVLLGFAELALAFKFLSVADMTAHWGILRYELFMGIWVLIALGMAAYMFGWIRFPHDNPERRITPAVGLFGIAFGILGIYLASGLLGSQKTGTYNSLGLMSGLAPPAIYNFFKPVAKVDEKLSEEFGSLTKCANNFNCFHDYYEGLAYAKAQNKPILLDFTGYGCVNCRKTEEHIWVNDKVWKKINNDFVLISLYVDDKLELDTALRSAVTNERIRTIGQVWKDFQV
ncbi:MAG TPA: cytochrome c biogenesis protein CcdA, partial [Saprospiraceae bacterium]|nr:cytochrome c biogenesis protein CcdA [Saprospiraceae bacterium]